MSGAAPTPTSGPDGAPASRRARIALIALLAVGVAVRFGGAWLFRNADNPDQGIVALMAKHIAEGLPFPVFFYGQTYMGSLEPAVSALLCRLFGYSGFAVALGTAAIGALLLPVVYALARDIAGRTAGLAAVAFCLVGPVGYFHYMHSPRGGYALTLVLALALPWYGGRLAVQTLESGRAPVAGHLLLGLLGGLGWWTNQLIAASLLATGLLTLAVLGRRAFGRPLAPAILGFAAGSLPFWVWNARHGWASFVMLRTLGTATYLEALRELLAGRLPDVLNAGFEGQRAAAGLGVAPVLAAAGGWLAAAILAGALAVVAATGAGRLRAAPRSLPAVQTAGLLLFLCCSILLASGSSYALLNTPRYLLPLVPAFAVIVGVATARVSGTLRGPIAFVPLALLVLWHAALVTEAFSGRLATQRTILERARQLGADLRAAGVTVVYVPYVQHILNALLEERFVFCDIKGERYAPYADRAERSDEVAVLGDYGHATDFVRSAGGTCAVAGSGGGTFVYRFRPPAAAEQEVPPTLWSSVADPARAGDLLGVLTDGDAGTAWRAAPATAGEPAVLEISFAAPTELSRVRLLTRGWFPGKTRWEILGRGSAPDAPWAPLAGEAFVTQFFWSGPRPYFGGAFQRLEARFPAATLGAIRIVLRFGAPGNAEVTEVQAFGPSGTDAVPEAQALPGLLELLDARGLSRLFCDRWVANAVRRRPANRIATPKEPSIYLEGGSVEHMVELLPGTALLAREEDAGICRRTLAASGIALRETPVGPWVLFDRAPAPGGGASPAGARPLLWAGPVCLRSTDARMAHADTVAELADSQTGK